jgi:Flp pilus assembly protein TadG
LLQLHSNHFHPRLPLRSLGSRLADQSGQAAIEFALVLPILVTFLFLITDFGRFFNAYNDLNQMAADGARMAAVGTLTQAGAPALVSASADTKTTRSATVTVSYPAGACAVGGTVKVTATTTVTFIPILKISPIPLSGHSEMRVEQCPS